MNKAQKTVLTLEIVLIAAGLLVIVFSSLGGGRGYLKDFETRLTALNDRLSEKETQFASNPQIVSIIQQKKAEITSMIEKYKDKSQKIDKAFEERKIINYEAEIETFTDDCLKMAKSIADVEEFIKAVEKFLSGSQEDIGKLNANKRISASEKKEIKELQINLGNGLKELKSKLSESKTPSSCTQLSLYAYDLRQPLAELKNKIEFGLKKINEKISVNTNDLLNKINTETQTKKQTRIKTKPEITRKVIPDYPAEFKGTGYFAIILVKIGASGMPAGTSVAQSSGNAAFDDFCRQQAMKLEFKPAIGYYPDEPDKLFPVESESQYPFKAPTQ